MGGRSLSSFVPIASAACLLAFCLAADPLYRSSTSTAALGQQLAETCRSDSALGLVVPSGPESADSPGAPGVTAIGAELEHVDPPRRITFASVFVVGSSGAMQRVTLLHIDGIESLLGLEHPLTPGRVAVSDTNLGQMATTVGATLTVQGGATLDVGESFGDVQIDPIEPDLCGWQELFEPTPSGDPPAPSLIASAETLTAFAPTRIDEYRVTQRPMTLAAGRAALASFERAADRWNDAYFPAGGQLPTSELSRIVERASAVAVTVERSLAPVVLTALVGVGVVLLASGVLLARARRQELHLLAVRGQHPVRIARHLLVPISIAVAIGTLAGALAALVGVRAFGPSDVLEPAAVRAAAIACTVAAIAAIASVGGIVGVAADRTVDPRRRRGGLLAGVTGVVSGLFALVVVAYRTLDREGGIRTFGVESRGGSLLAMGYALFVVLAAGVTAGAVTGVATPYLRLSGAALSRSLRLGWRRVVLDPGPVAAVVAATALATGCFLTSSGLAAASRRQLDDKAAVYVGADLAVTVFGDPVIPADWADRTTLTQSSRALSGGTSFDLVGVDRSSFADVARPASGHLTRPMAELLAMIAPPSDPLDDAPLADPSHADPPPAIAVGGEWEVGEIVDVPIRGSRQPLPVKIAARTDVFPGKVGGAVLIVVDHAVVAAHVSVPVTTLLVRDPPPGAVDQLRAAGTATGAVKDVTTAFSGSSYSAQRWAYLPMAVLGGLFAAVALAIQLLVVSTRRETRRVGHLVMQRTGLTRRQLLIASVVEAAIPLAVGAVVGVAAGLVATASAVPRLDPMPTLLPGARFSPAWGGLAATAAIIPIWAILLALLIRRTTERADPMEAMRGVA